MCDLVKNRNGSLRFCKKHGVLTETSKCELSWVPFWGTLAELQAEVGDTLVERVEVTDWTYTTIYRRTWHPVLVTEGPVMAWGYTDEVIWKKPWS